MAIVTHKPRRNLGTFMDNSFNRTCHPYLFPQPLFWSCVQKKDRMDLLGMSQVIGHQCHIPSPHFHHFTPYWFPPLVSLYSPAFHIYIPYMEALMTSPILFLRWIDGSVTRCDGFQTGGYPANSRGGPSNSQSAGR